MQYKSCNHSVILFLITTLSCSVVESYGQIKWERHKMNLSGETGPGKCNKIFFINDRFFATGADNIIASSIDGISWTTVTAGSPGTRKESIAYGPSG